MCYPSYPFLGAPFADKWLDWKRDPQKSGAGKRGGWNIYPSVRVCVKFILIFLCLELFFWSFFCCLPRSCQELSLLFKPIGWFSSTHSYIGPCTFYSTVWNMRLCECVYVLAVCLCWRMHEGFNYMCNLFPARPCPKLMCKIFFKLYSHSWHVLLKGGKRVEKKGWRLSSLWPHIMAQSYVTLSASEVFHHASMSLGKLNSTS